jgi:hypothetical protein
VYVFLVKKEGIIRKVLNLVPSVKDRENGGKPKGKPDVLIAPKGKTGENGGKTKGKTKGKTGENGGKQGKTAKNGECFHTPQ